MTNFNDDIVELLTEATLDITRAAGAREREILDLMRVLAEDLTVVLVNHAPGEAKTLKAINRGDLYKEARKAIDRRFAQAASRNDALLEAVGRATQEQIISVINTAMGSPVMKKGFKVSQITQFADDTLVVGEPAVQFWKDQPQKLLKQFKRQVTLGFNANETTEEIIRRVRGTSTGQRITITDGSGKKRRVTAYKGGVMQTNSNQVRSLVRTSVQSMSNDVYRAYYEQNSDVIRGVKAITTLDSRTSDICMARTGGAWNLETGEPLPDSTVQESYPGTPPWHYGCRTVLAPIVRAFEDIQEQGNDSRNRSLKKVNERTRATMDGQIDSGRIKTFDDFLKLKGDAWAEAKLGPGRFKLWKEGKITTSQLINSNGDSVPLADLA